MTERRSRLGEALRSLRQRQGWSLTDVSRRTGISTSALSKVENDRLSLTYDKLAALSEGLGVDISYFFGGADGPAPVAFTGRRSVDREGGSVVSDTPNYLYRYLNTELSRKKMVPLVVEHRARTLQEFGDYVRHAGEEFLYVLEGRLELRTEFYAPTVLEVGESLYIDSTMGHAYLNVGEGVCRTLAVCTAPEAQLNQAVSKARESVDARANSPTAARQRQKRVSKAT